MTRGYVGHWDRTELHATITAHGAWTSAWSPVAGRWPVVSERFVVAYEPTEAMARGHARALNFWIADEHPPQAAA